MIAARWVRVRPTRSMVPDARTVPHIREGKSITFLPSVLREWMVDRSLASLREQHTPATAPVTRKRRINL